MKLLCAATLRLASGREQSGHMVGPGQSADAGSSTLRNLGIIFYVLVHITFGSPHWLQ